MVRQLCLASLVLLAACGGNGKAVRPAVSIRDFKFSPATLTVKPDENITYTNADGQPHTATADRGNAFDAGSIAVGGSATVEVAEPGTYPYHCSFHPFMTGTITVE